MSTKKSHFDLNLVPKNYKSFFVTPSLRANLFPEAGISPWVSGAEASAISRRIPRWSLAGPTPAKPGPQAESSGRRRTRCQLVRSFSVRGEVRDFYSGVPQLNVDTGKSRQHNLFCGRRSGLALLEISVSRRRGRRNLLVQFRQAPRIFDGIIETRAFIVPGKFRDSRRGRGIVNPERRILQESGSAIYASRAGRRFASSARTRSWPPGEETSPVAPPAGICSAHAKGCRALTTNQSSTAISHPRKTPAQWRTGHSALRCGGLLPAEPYSR